MNSIEQFTDPQNPPTGVHGDVRAGFWVINEARERVEVELGDWIELEPDGRHYRVLGSRNEPDLG